MAPNGEERRRSVSVAGFKTDNNQEFQVEQDYISPGSVRDQHHSWKIGHLLKVDEAPSYAREKAITTGYRHPLGYTGCIRR